MSAGNTGGPFHMEREEELTKALAEEARRRPPDLQEKQLFAQTRYILDPIGVPRSHANEGDFVQRLRSNFRLRFDDSDFRSPPFTDEPNHVELMQRAVTRDDPWTFINGMLRLQAPPRHTPIETVSVTSEAYRAAVVGSTTESSWVAQQVAEELWAATGAERRWSELSDAILGVGYRTTTKVRLGINIEDFFRPAFRNFITQNIETGGSLGVKMGIQAFDKEFAEESRKDTILISDVRRVLMRVTLFNKVSGLAEECELRFEVTSRDEARRGIIEITTELDSQAHTELITRLREGLTASP